LTLEYLDLLEPEHQNSLMSEAVGEILVQISGLILDPDSKIPIVILRDAIGEQILPIWIGAFEANAIAVSLEGKGGPRPMTHDLLLQAIDSLGGELERVVITDLQEDTFFASIYLTRGERELVLDARPSDALALGVRAGIPFFVRAQVLEKAKANKRLGQISEKERLKKWLEEVNPEELGKYTM